MNFKKISIFTTYLLGTIVFAQKDVIIEKKYSKTIVRLAKSKKVQSAFNKIK